MHVINLTPHPLTLYSADTSDVVQDPSVGVLAVWEVAGPMARHAETRQPAGSIAFHTPGGEVVHVPLTEVGSGEVTGLPDPRPGVTCIVSRATAERTTGRADVVYPDRPVRSTSGQIVGYRALARAVTGQTLPDTYRFQHKNPRRVLGGKRWEDYVNGQFVTVLSPDIASQFGTVPVRVGAALAHLHGEVVRELHEALGYARRRADHPQCPECREFGEPIAGEWPMWQCPAGHRWDVETALSRIRPCTECHGYGNL
ncbi:hypothetical protein [Acrocarpospora catenulata]|uniref:hypothetical protein n=1 Tax=Acrocarpospora catenulata TaxID=2836182 RepID=UPI001BD9C066|nr:hypothetical protein [Acrocarpospora catenulata]